MSKRDLICAVAVGILAADGVEFLLKVVAYLLFR